ncbi:MAG: hypothetical protein FJ284_08605 [Planctomycetes bacterium]|nr:hypothetical protein [Planctomycetota bacterium]
MRSLRRVIAVVSLVCVGSVMQAEPARAQRVCHGLGPRYGLPVARRCWHPGGWYGGWRACGWTACPPWGGYAWPSICSPRPWCGPWYGWPGCGGGGWYGGATFFGDQSVSLAWPAGGGATFFSGSVVPFPVLYAVPYGVPCPVAVPWFGAPPRPAAPPVIPGACATPLVARGMAILRAIAAEEDGRLPEPLAELATVWAGGRPRPIAAVASVDSRAMP